jgi:hypothetical protein
LTGAPDAPDADGIRERLAKLEQSTLGYSSASTDVPGDVEGGATATGKSSGNASGTAPTSGGVRPDDMEYIEREGDPLQTPLRRGKGWSLAPFFSVHKWGETPVRAVLAPGVTSITSFGSSGSWAECVGLEVRYAFGPSFALLVEGSYEHFNSNAVDLAVLSGLSAQIGVEWHVPLDADYENQFIVAPGIGYEHLVIEPGVVQPTAASVGAFVPRVRLGWRHLLLPSAGIDLSLDGGVANFFAYRDFPFDSSNPTTFLVALNVALVWGM